jgi:hypothetical protein
VWFNGKVVQDETRFGEPKSKDLGVSQGLIDMPEGFRPPLGLQVSEAVAYHRGTD